MSIIIRRYLRSVLTHPAGKYGLALLVFPLLNTCGNLIVRSTPVPIFMDSLFTGVSAVLFGLPLGLATGALTNLYGDLAQGFTGLHLPFALCNMSTAAIIHVMHSRGILKTPLQFFIALVAVAVANSVLGSLIAVYVFGGGTGTNIDILVSGFQLAIRGLFSSAFLARLAVNLVDKAPALFAAMAAGALASEGNGSRTDAE